MLNSISLTFYHKCLIAPWCVIPTIARHDNNPEGYHTTQPSHGASKHVRFSLFLKEKNPSVCKCEKSLILSLKDLLVWKFLFLKLLFHTVCNIKQVLSSFLLYKGDRFLISISKLILVHYHRENFPSANSCFIVLGLSFKTWCRNTTDTTS